MLFPTSSRAYADSFVPDLRSPFTIHEDIREVAETEPGLTFGSSKGASPEDNPEQATLRTRSLRGWSTSSATPTASDTSSNPFQRPHSRHTANTSIDLSHSTPSLTKFPSHASLDSGTAMSPQPIRSGNGTITTFNIDDYISSDDDFAEPRRPRAEGEEDLLFSDSGYGLNGFQLPGLNGSLARAASSPKDKQLLAHARSSISLPPIYDCDSFGRAGARRFILDTAADSEDESDDLDSPLASPQSLGSRPSSSPGTRSTKRLSAIGGSPMKGSPMRSGRSHHGRHPSGCAHEVIEEERTGKVDVAAAVKLRKEAKARKRASGVPSAARPRKARSAAGSLGAAVTTVRVEIAVDDEANHADVE